MMYPIRKILAQEMLGTTSKHFVYSTPENYQTVISNIVLHGRNGTDTVYIAITTSEVDDDTEPDDKAYIFEGDVDDNGTKEFKLGMTLHQGESLRVWAKTTADLISVNVFGEEAPIKY